MKNQPPFRRAALAAAALSLGLAAAARADNTPPTMDPRATPVAPAPSLSTGPSFAPDPVNLEPYDPQAQMDVYGAKYMNPTAGPLLDFGGDLYGLGPLSPGINLFGAKDELHPQFLLFGDWRTAVASNENGKTTKDLVATRLDLDFDLRITATERIVLIMTPLNDAEDFSRVEFGGDHPLIHTAFLDLKPDALFMEGDLARIASGLTGANNQADIPFAVGLTPLLFQNGIWMNDAIAGGAVTIPARNSAALGISNMDVTFFGGYHQVNTAAIPNDHEVSLFGFNAFIEANHGYWEFGYARVDGTSRAADLSYNNLALAFTRRYWELISNSVRVIANFGQNPDPGHADTANGLLLLFENSLVSSQESVLVPYLNGWAGFHEPQSVARNADAGGILGNTGIVFESDDLTGFPNMDNTGHNTAGAALGVEYLFDLHQQIVFEIAALSAYGNAAERTAAGNQYGAGIRYQLPLNNAWIFRADAIGAVRDNEQNLLGFRLELRRKF
jgi:hypothetical protein